MRASTILLTILGLTALAATNASAVGRPESAPLPPRLYKLDTTARPLAKGRWDAPEAVEEFIIQVDPETVAADPPAFTINLPTLPPLEARRTRFVDYRPDWKSWIGTLRPAGTEEEGSGYIHLGYHGRQLTALIEFEGERYRIVGGLGESHRLVRLSDEQSVPSCGLDTSSARPLRLNGDLNGEKPRRGSQRLTKVATRIDVLAVYPKTYFAFGPASEAGVFNFIADSISLANDVFTNSQVNAFYNLVSTVPITGAQPPATGIFDALTWLNGQPTEVASLRNAFGADVVTIFVPFIWSTDPYCGVANLPQNNNTFLSSTGTVAQPMGDRAFTANRDGCGQGDFTLGHEIGHNYGMYHGDQAPSPLALFSYGRGYVFSASGQNKATAMACYCVSGCTAGSGAVCNRIPYFSDPNLSYLGVPIGTSSNNNAAVGRAQVASYAGFRAQSSNTPPTANFTVSCSGRTCTFNASGSTDNTTIPSTGYWWDFGDGSASGSGKIVNHTYSFGTFFWVHLVVKDSGGQTDVTLASASPQ